MKDGINDDNRIFRSAANTDPRRQIAWRERDRASSSLSAAKKAKVNGRLAGAEEEGDRFFAWPWAAHFSSSTPPVTFRSATASETTERR